ncbi:hypothetical protein GGR88_001352 [Sphingomonas jejuensis]|uniref:Uncharacterized protein n=1 Tax=Sphingomonas jejuensis TaxID=904715 RepID=A0ABX0XL46_9SPHN|nr:hypothetical protein [Sphingomonas jejuensis]NJC33878.1 hypothetical protein [Sphingomonas jejuensis]
MTDHSRSLVRRHSLPVAARRSVGSAPAQPRSDLADQLEAITPRFDALTQRARLSAPDRDVATYHDLEEMAQAVCRDIMAPFRGGEQPTAAPLYRSPNGKVVVW